MKLTSLATLAAIVFTSSLSASPFDMREVDMSSLTSVTSKINLKMKIFREIRGEFDKSELKTDGVSCEVNFTEIDNRSGHEITFGAFTIPAFESRLFAQGLKKVNDQPGSETLFNQSYPLKAALPIYARDMAGLVPQEKLMGLHSIVTLQIAEATKASGETFKCLHLTSNFDGEFVRSLGALTRVEKLFLDTDREFAEMDRIDTTADTSTGACSD